MKNNKPATDLSTRVIPSQDRAKKSVDLILETTAELLEEVGIDSFNTNLLAKRAGIRVRTIYRYFPNKMAVITALYMNWQQRVIDNIYVLTDSIADPRNDWREELDNLFQAFFEMTQQESTYVHLRRAVRSVPELIALEEEAIILFVERLMAAFTQRGLSLPEKQMRAICKLLTENAVSFSDIISTDGRAYAEELKKEFTVSYQSYLNNYLD